MHTHLIAAQVWRHHRGMPAPVLAKVADKQLVLVSTGASDWIESNGTATKTDTGFRVSGRKAPASGAPAGDILVTSIRWEDAPDGPQVIHAAVPFATEGVSIEETWDTLGMRATGSHTVVLDDVVIPDEAVSLIRPGNEWHPVWSTVMGAAMPLIMSSYVGVAEAAAERAVALATRRATRPDVAPVVGRMLGRLTSREGQRAGDDRFEPQPELRQHARARGHHPLPQVDRHRRGHRHGVDGARRRGRRGLPRGAAASTGCSATCRARGTTRCRPSARRASPAGSRWGSTRWTELRVVRVVASSAAPPRRRPRARPPRGR